MTHAPYRFSRGGQVIPMLALFMALLMSLAAMTVDLVYAYTVKAKLVTAVDASALGASRALVNGSNLSEQQAAVNEAVDRLFDANFPNGFMMTTSRSHSLPTIIDNGDGTRSVSLTGNATVPTFFMRVAGYETLPVAASATALRRDVNLMLVLDRSGSLVLNNPSDPAFPKVQAAAKFFVDQFDVGRDRLGLVSFGTTGAVDYTPQTGFKTALKSKVDSLAAFSSNRTNSALGLYLAFHELRKLNDPPALNVIVFFTDGQSTAFAANFPVKTSGSLRCTSSPRMGVYMTNQTGGAVDGLFKWQAGPPPAQPNPSIQRDYEIIANCPGLNSDGSNGENLITSIPTFWNPITTPPNSDQVSIFGPNSVSTSNLTSGQNVIKVGDNMAINAAALARQHPLEIRIYSIGMGGYLYPADDQMLMRVANDPASAAYDPNQPTGLYVYAPNETQLQQAFQRVASEISRLIQ